MNPWGKTKKMKYLGCSLHLIKALQNGPDVALLKLWQRKTGLKGLYPTSEHTNLSQ